MDFDFLTPLDDNLVIEIKNFSSQQLASKMVLHTKNEFPDVSKVQIAIIGILENRGNTNSHQNNVDISNIRKQLYQLYPGNWSQTIADLGDILAGNTIEDTYFAVKQVVAELLKNKTIPILIGGSQDLTYALYRSYDNLEQMVNLVCIDNKFDFGKQEETITSQSYLSKIITQEPNNLFNFCNLGYQTYYNSQEEIDLIEKLYFDAYRLGEISNNLVIAEPVLRDADLVSIDMNVVKTSASGNFANFEPNGFNGKEICTLSRYAGISDKVTCLGIFSNDNNAQEAVLVSQIIWYFIEGIHYRSKEYPFGSKDNYTKYIVPFDEENIVFYKSDKTERWWIEIPFFLNTHNKLKKHTLLPCSHQDYLSACNQEFPERWWKAQRKNLV